MISLQDICSLPIEFDDFENEVKLSDLIRCGKKRSISIDSAHFTQ